jgi:hypothetical protein
MLGFLCVTPATFLPAVFHGQSTTGNDIPVAELLELRRGGASAITTDPAFDDQDFCRRSRCQRKERFTKTGPPGNQDEQEDNDAEKTQPRGTPNGPTLKEPQLPALQKERFGPARKNGS